MKDGLVYTITEQTRSEIKIKRSTFIGTISPAHTVEDAEQFVDSIRAEFSDATHNCFAYRINENLFRYYDDGEPSNTAGKPILAMLDKYRLHETVLVVTRYFGGTKLGVGGLIQAYSQCAEETIQKAKRIPLVHYQRFRIRYPYQLNKQMEYWVTQFEGRIEKSEFEAEITSIIAIPEEHAASFQEQLASNGKHSIQIIQLSDD